MRTWITTLWLALAWSGSSTGQEPVIHAASRRFQLENGLTAMVRHIRGRGDITLLVLYKVGGDHDPEGRSGLAHLVEHVYVTAAAGAVPSRTADAYFRHYRGGCNAQTGDRYAVFATVFSKDEFERELAEASARMGDLRITTADLDREKPRLLDELANMFGRIPALGARNNARELIRPTPRGGRRAGRPEHVRAIAAEDVQMHWKRYYKPRNAILVLAGAVDEGAARRAIIAHFAQLPAGEPIPDAHDPGKPRFGTVKELTIAAPLPKAEPTAGLAYLAPQPDSELYAPFLVLVLRLWAGASKLGGAGPSDFPVVFTPLDDGAVVAISAKVNPGESNDQAIRRLEAFVVEATAPKLRDQEAATARQAFGTLLGIVEQPGDILAQDPYGVAFSLARRERLGLDPAKLNRALDALTDDDLRRAAAEVFAPDRHAGVAISIEKN
jgi:zinc protease